ncbi:heat stress transcription factor A-4a-like [Brassica napus]|uniref:heat stress transcription factor A-4a-like n=1 Tax=Brassica napus TaxID=3708 RepID=UPI002078B839|nr:heat stress transcription factor A-4a-like [Brassica napus]
MDSSSSSQGLPVAGRVKEYYRYPAMEAFHKGCVRRYFADVLYEMVDDPSTDSIVSWSQDGKSFIFWDQDKFCSDVLPKFGLSTSPTFFVRLTNIYCFRKVEESEHCEYAHDYFVRGKPELTVEIERQFKERGAPIKLAIKPHEPAYKESRERIRAFMLAKKAARSLSLKE